MASDTDLNSRTQKRLRRYGYTRLPTPVAQLRTLSNGRPDQEGGNMTIAGHTGQPRPRLAVHEKR